MRNNNPSNNPLVLAGPTGVGKSHFAARLALRAGGEIVCGDAFQLYRGIAVLTAHPDAELLAAVPHHLYGILPPAEECGAGRFADMARAACAGIVSRGRFPILVGGSGFYLRAFTHGLSPFPQPDNALRQSLSALPLSQLLERLAAIDPAALPLIDVKNPRRVGRAIEICEQTGTPFSEWLRREKSPPIPHVGISLDRSPDELAARIDANVERLWRGGAVGEVRNLLSSGMPFQPASRAIGFHEIREFLEGRIGEDEAKRRIKFATRQYAKRQRTWFRSRSQAFERILVTPANESRILETLLAKIASA